MKQFFAFIIAGLLIAGCAAGGAGNPDEDIVEITERFFVTQLMELFTNPDEFIGRTIRYEGMFSSHLWEHTGEYFHFVYRYTDGCCSPEETAGLEVYLNNFEPLPDNAWVEVVGVFERFESGGSSFLRLNVISLVELEERGAEFVSGM